MSVRVRPRALCQRHGETVNASVFEADILWVRISLPLLIAACPSGQVTVCKTVYIGSNPIVAFVCRRSRIGKCTSLRGWRVETLLWVQLPSPTLPKNLEAIFRKIVVLTFWAREKGLFLIWCRFSPCHDKVDYVNKSGKVFPDAVSHITQI